MSKPVKSSLEFQADQFIDASLSVGATSSPNNSSASINIIGTASSPTSCPSLLLGHTGSDHHAAQLFVFNNNNISDLRGSYYNSGYKASNSSGYRDWLNGTNHRREFKVFSGKSAGDSITFTESFWWDLTNGDATAKQNFTVDGDLSVNTIEGVSISDTQFGYLGALNQGLTTTSNVTFNQITGTLQTAAQTNITSVGTLTGLDITQNIAGDAITILSDNDTKNTSLAIGRSAVEANLAVVSSTAQYFTNTYAGDTALKSIGSGSALILGVSSTGTMTILPSKVGINERSPYNSLDIGGNLSVGYSAEVAPSNGAIFAGKVAIGTASPATSAALDVTSTTGALLLPRMTTTQRNSLTAVNGMLIYNTTDNKFQGYENGAWANLI